MRKLITLALLLLLTACASESTEDGKSKEVKASADVVAAETENQPWEKYTAQEVYDLVESGEEVYSLEHAEPLENEFFRLYEAGELTSEWGNYLYVFGAELTAKHPENEEYFKLIANAGVNVKNENYDEAKNKLKDAEALRGAN
ncbi:hypothetical protein H9655_21070 [Cytobacillus sp. Sa5YUA1]|uniref:Lipoprotein n=1 Tax=Cytobacillus stercorigallinarum TaxID=2762240 RepID=A0ABR8QVL1_9BACI|nr:hypothetical protein [Cytobacillus stercorigallinarum]MBD7939538.1 hypothetical protein [Cytobacillus stercorigallinarum]